MAPGERSLRSDGTFAREEDDLQRDLGLDSLELMSLAVALEDRFELELAETATTIRTVGDLATHLAVRLAERGR